MKTHIMRFAPQDYRTSRTRTRSIQTRDPMLRLVYLEALFALYEAGGSLPADPAALADELGLPAKEIAKRLGTLDEIARTGSGRGGLLIQDGRVTNGRVTSDLKSEEEYRADQARFGREGGRGRKKGDPKATLSAPKGSPSPPSPYPAPSPAPAPAPTTNTPAGADRRAGGADGNSSPGSNGSPPAPPAGASSGNGYGDGLVLDHDPTDPAEVRLASRIAHLAQVTETAPLDVLAAVSSPPEGERHLDHIRGAPPSWVEATLRACDAFEADNSGGGEPPEEE